MHSPVIYERSLDDIVSAGHEQPGNRIPQQVVPDVTEMQRLIRVRGRKLDHDVPARGR